MNKNRTRIKGSICSVELEEIEASLLRGIRCLDLLSDEFAGGKSLASVLRG